MTKSRYENVQAMGETKAGSLVLNGNGLIYYPASEDSGTKIKVKWTHLQRHQMTAASNPRNLLQLVHTSHATNTTIHTLVFQSRDDLVKVDQDIRYHLGTTPPEHHHTNTDSSWNHAQISVSERAQAEPLLVEQRPVRRNPSPVVSANRDAQKTNKASNKTTNSPSVVPPPKPAHVPPPKQRKITTPAKPQKPTEHLPLIPDDASTPSDPGGDADASNSTTHHSSNDLESASGDKCKEDKHNKPLNWLYGAVACLVVTLLLIILISIILCSTGNCFGRSNKNRPLGDPSNSCMSSFSKEYSPSDPPVYTPKFFALRDYSVNALKNISSPQSRAYYWTVSGYDCPELQFMPLWKRQQLFALASFYYSVFGDSEYYWLDVSSSACVWTGISCQPNGQVKSIEFLSESSSYPLKGTVPPEIELLSPLETLRLYYSSDSESPPLQDAIPWKRMKSLDKLRNLTLSGFSRGFLPPEVGTLTSLVRFELESNHLLGSLPTEIWSLTNLQKLYLTNNNMTGTLTKKLGYLTDLTLFSVAANRLSGPIPSEISLLTKLTELSLEGNRLSKSIPIELGSLQKLKYLELNSNLLSGNVPTTLGQLKELQGLDLSSNALTGNIPIEFGWLSNVTVLSLANNKLNGTLHAQLAMAQLSSLDLSKNQLTGPIPTQLIKLATDGQLKLSLRSNPDLFIPTDIQRLENLTSLDLSGQGLSRSIPREISRLTKLTTLNLENNNLKGPLPSELGLLTDLRSLEVQNNQLSGLIPSELGLLTQLTSLSLNNNALMGPIPSELGELVFLADLLIHDNPQLEGEIPESVCNLQGGEYYYSSGLKPIGIAGTKLSCPDNCDCHSGGSIFDTPIDDLMDRSYWSVAYEGLTGTIPTEVGLLTGMFEVDLSFNNLSGSVPSEFGLLTYLTTLDLSWNDLAGTLPEAVCRLQLEHDLNILRVDCDEVFCPNSCNCTCTE